MDIAAWLGGLGLEQYAPVLRDNGIDMQVLPKLTAEDLRELGITMVGHRRILLEAIAALREPASPPDSASKPTSGAAAAREAERRHIALKAQTLQPRLYVHAVVLGSEERHLHLFEDIALPVDLPAAALK